jgi:D-3-phosphoglycerate dehydrogenase
MLVCLNFVVQRRVINRGIDVEEATKLGIVVVNSPSGNIGAAAEHTIALMMSMARKIPESCASLKDGKWERSKFVGVEVKGKTLSIIGLGKGKYPSIGLFGDMI